MSAPDLWALWPDALLCPLAEVEEYLQPPCARSDDFQRVQVTKYDEAGEPCEWVGVPPC